MSTAIPLENETNVKTVQQGSAAVANMAIASTLVTLICLASLHILSPEFDPSWRMVSEYALGKYPWVLSLLFITWATGTWAVAYLLKNAVKTTGGKIGRGFLILSGIGEAMAAFFDVQHPLHSVAALIGIPSLPIAAILIAISLNKNPSWKFARKKIMLATHFTWISIVLMTIGVMVLFAGFNKAGVDMSSGKAPESLPAGVIAFAGWANRFLVVCYCIWTITVAVQCKKLSTKESAAHTDISD
jgi:hypothetical protein